ncbi:MAG: hypothetical protein HYR96_06980 [Deltaproteobacteria bacterium]|nr:hypothetical protein [Deltaproteobacteria bacterium]MBI3295355.1 hypothetical protein [Deltaproteobacteria bacterium]
MFFARTREGRNLLKPFVLKIRDGFLVGMAPDPVVGAPCATCVQLWLADRRVWFEPGQLSDLNVKKEVLLDLMAKNQAHTFYEIHKDGTTNRLDCVVYPHAQCTCNKANYCPPTEITKKSNFAFSPLYQIKCARYGTPDGNLWLSSATGQSHITEKSLTVYGAARDREASRLNAVDEWLRKVSIDELRQRNQAGESIAQRSFQTDSSSIVPRGPIAVDAIGCGASGDEALLDGLSRLSLVRTLKKYSAKSPMLIVGANTWIRGRVPFFMLQQYDLHLLFYPNSTPTWVVGILALSRLRTEEPPLFAFASYGTMGTAIDQAIGKILVHCRPTEWNPSQTEPSKKKAQNASKLHLWWTNWVYRCPKISLRDVLHLEDYAKDVELWRNYFKDGQEPVSLIAINSPLLPSGIRSLVALQSQEAQETQRPRNINGIGIWSNVSELLHV